jgi:septum formation protein
MLILASASPRRQELLRSANIAFSVRPANITEVRRPDEAPDGYVRRLAREKVQAIAGKIIVGDVVLGADTEVVLDLRRGTPLGKPRDAEDAARMLRLLSGRSHYVLTGVCLLWKDTSNQTQTAEASETTVVHFQQIDEREILDYIATAEPLDKAGAYAIQGIASRWIPRIEGCYFNVVGLPVPLVYRMLREHAPQVLAGD